VLSVRVIVAGQFVAVAFAACTSTVNLNNLGSGGGPSSTTDSTTASTSESVTMSSTGVGGAGAGGADTSYRQLVLADGAVAYFRLGDLDTMQAKDEVGGPDGAYIDATLGTTGAIADDPDTSATFKAVGSRMEIGDRFDFTGTAAFSIEVWTARDAAIGDSGTLIAKCADIGGYCSGYFMSLSASTGNLRFHRGDGLSLAGVATPQPAPGTFAHVVATYDGRMLRLYVDGVSADAVSSMTPLVDRPEPLTIGYWVTWGSYHGSLDEVAIYDMALDPAIIANHYMVGIGAR